MAVGESTIILLTVLSSLITISLFWKKIYSLIKQALKKNRETKVHNNDDAIDALIDYLNTWKKDQDLAKHNLKSELLKVHFDSNVHKVAFNTALLMVGEVLQLVDFAADQIKSDSTAVDILLAQINDLRGVLREFVIYEGNQQRYLEREREIRERYENILAKLEIAIPVLQHQQREWLFDYRKLKNK